MQKASTPEEAIGSMYAVGVDSGTQGTKVLVVDFDGNVRGRGYAAHALIQGLRPGESEQDPGVWLSALDAALKKALNEANVPGSQIVCLGVSGQQHGMVALDEKGHALRPAKLWNDTSTVEETEILVDKLGGPEGTIQTLGIGLAVGYTASKILWLKRHEPDNYRKLSVVPLPHNYINFALTGRAHMEYGDASGTGLMDIRTRTWQKKAIEAIDPELEEKLPPLSHPSEAVGFMQKEIARRYGMEKVLVASGGGDNMMGAIGTGNVTPGVCTLSLGTSGTIYSYFESPFLDPDGEIAGFCDSTGGWLPLLCTMNVTNTTECFKAFLNISTSELERLASKSPPGAEKLLFLPFLDGERVPVLPQASGVFFGLNRRNFRPSHLARSIMEGTILNLGYGFSRMKAMGLKPSEIRATGGGSRSALWLQIAANVFETPVMRLVEQEAAAFGAAIQSIWNYELSRGNTISIQEITQEMVRLKEPMVDPHPETSALYRSLQERFNSLWNSLKQEFESHHAL
ncbi:MAG: xylulokinase [Candidatus Aminicenantales bacterium]